MYVAIKQLQNRPLPIQKSTFSKTCREVLFMLFFLRLENMRLCS